MHVGYDTQTILWDTAHIVWNGILLLVCLWEIVGIGTRVVGCCDLDDHECPKSDDLMTMAAMGQTCQFPKFYHVQLIPPF